MRIRQIRIEDAGAFLKLLLQLDDETRFMMLESGERSQDVAEQRKRIESALGSPNSMMFVAEHENESAAESPVLVGFLGAYGGGYRRNQHSAHIVAGILGAYTGQGIGRKLFEALDAWAIASGLHRLELTVMCHNARALALYQKMGFSIEGTIRHSLKVDGEFIDEYLMGKLIG